MGAGVTLTPHERSEIRALLALRERPGLGDRGIRKLLDRTGSAVGALKALEGGGVDGNRSEVDSEMDSWKEGGFGVIPMTSPSYPASLMELVDPPPLLFLRGDKALLTEPAVAIVGSRRATEAGRRAAERIGRILAEAGVTVVSGLALGIDGAAHRGALQGGGKTLAVLGCGLGRVYPAAHRGLFREIGRKGLLVSEFLPGESALPHHFPKRNRVIAALSRAVVVVEAGNKSGALITVDHGLDLGREIFVVPGSVENPQAAGSNALLREGARVVPDPGAILDELSDLGFQAWKGREVTGGPGPDGDRVPPELRVLWEGLSERPLSVEEIAQETAIPLAAALAGLSALELGGWARQGPGMRFHRR